MIEIIKKTTEKRAKICLEAEILKHTGHSYILFMPSGKLLHASPKANEVLWNLGLSEKDMKSVDAMITGLKSQELKNYDTAARQILHEEILLEDELHYSAISEFEGYYTLAQVKKMKEGSYVVFKDITREYTFLSAGDRLSFNAETVLSLMQYLPTGVALFDARDLQNTMLCINAPMLRIINTSHTDVQNKPFMEVISRYFYHKDLYLLAHDFIQNPSSFSLDIKRHNEDEKQHMRVHMDCIFNEDGNALYFMITAEDLMAAKEPVDKSRYNHLKGSAKALINRQEVQENLYSLAGNAND